MVAAAVVAAAGAELAEVAAAAVVVMAAAMAAVTAAAAAAATVPRLPPHRDRRCVLQEDLPRFRAAAEYASQLIHPGAGLVKRQKAAFTSGFLFCGAGLGGLRRCFDQKPWGVT